MPTRHASPKRIYVLGLALGLTAVPVLASPSLAQTQTTTAQPAATSQTMSVTTQARDGTTTTRTEEVIIMPRSIPSYEEDEAYHRAEYERLRVRYEKPAPLNTRADTLMDVPQGKLPQDRSNLRAIIHDPDTPHLEDVLNPQPK